MRCSNAASRSSSSRVIAACANGSSPKRGSPKLTHFKPGTIVTSSRFSPDGTSIVFGTTGVGGNADLYVMETDGTRIHPVTHTKLWDSAPGWGRAR